MSGTSRFRQIVLPMCLLGGTFVSGCASMTGRETAAGSKGFSLFPPISAKYASNGSKDYASYAEVEESKPLTREGESRLQARYGELQEQRGNHAEARKMYERSLKANRKSVDALVGLARLDAANGNVKQAEKRFEEALRIAPNNPAVLSTYGQILADDGQWDRALQLQNQAVLAAPDSKEHRHALAVNLARAGRTQEALAQFTRTVGTASAHYNVGVILHERGDVAAAEREFVFALKVDPNLEDARDWLVDLQGTKAAGQPQVAAVRGKTQAPARGAVSPASAADVPARRAVVSHPQPRVRPVGASEPQPRTWNDKVPETARADSAPTSAAQLEQMRNQR